VYIARRSAELPPVAALLTRAESCHWLISGPCLELCVDAVPHFALWAGVLGGVRPFLDRERLVFQILLIRGSLCRFDFVRGEVLLQSHTPKDGGHKLNIVSSPAALHMGGSKRKI
jgi:hypothetical protein